MAVSPLISESILSHMADALPTHSNDDTSSDISSSYEAIALFCHACLIAVGFRLLGFKEGQKISQELGAIAPRLPAEWNSSFGSHSFLYAHSQSSMEYVLKVDRLGGKAEIRGIGLGDEKIARLEITAKDYISSAALPLRITISSNGEEDRSDLQQKLKDIFISPSRIADLQSKFRFNIIAKLIPNISKDGYEITPESNNGNSQQVHDEQEEAHARRGQSRDPLVDPGYPQPARPYPHNDPLAAPPRRPFPAGEMAPPGFDDELDMNRPLRGMAPAFPGARSPYGIGHDDLNPPGLGPYDPLRGSFTGGGGLGMGGGGMHPTFDDPLFGGRGQGQGGWGQGPGNAPPGARYDPTGPGGAPRGSGGGNAPHNPFGGFGSNDFM